MKRLKKIYEYAIEKDTMYVLLGLTGIQKLYHDNCAYGLVRFVLIEIVFFLLMEVFTVLLSSRLCVCLCVQAHLSACGLALLFHCFNFIMIYFS